MNDEDKNYENLIQMALDNLKGQAQYDFIIDVLKDERAKAKEEAQKEIFEIIFNRIKEVKEAVLAARITKENRLDIYVGELKEEIKGLQQSLNIPTRFKRGGFISVKYL